MELDSTTGTAARIHLVALPHTHLTKTHDWCAYTAKLRRFTHMLTQLGHHTIVYGPVEHELPAGVDVVPIVTGSDRQRWFGSWNWDNNRVFDAWDVEDRHWVETNARAVEGILARWEPGDILGLIAGRCQQPIADALRARHHNPLVWEWGIGYSGVLADSHKTYESYAWAHHVAGLQHKDDVAFFDSVVPNCYDANDFEPSTTVGDYLLFMGRPTPRKGLPVIAEIAQRTHLPIKVAGQPGADIPNTEYVGLVTGTEKAQLLAGARALLAPTTYLEPFGGVVVEAAMSGTPAITTDWGAFTETVRQGVTGYRCRTLADFLRAVDEAETINRYDVLDHARQYTLTAGALAYGDVIARLRTLHRDGWYELPTYLRGRVGSRS